MDTTHRQDVRLSHKKIAFGAPFGGLGATYDVHLRLIGKLVGDSLFIIELFSLGAFDLSQYTRLADGQTDRQTDGRTESQSQYRAYASQSHGNNEAVDSSPRQQHVRMCRISRRSVILFLLSINETRRLFVDLSRRYRDTAKRMME